MFCKIVLCVTSRPLIRDDSSGFNFDSRAEQDCLKCTTICFKPLHCHNSHFLYSQMFTITVSVARLR